MLFFPLAIYSKEAIKLDRHDYVRYVNTIIGTDSSSNFSHGNKYPFVAVPNPMLLLSADMNPGTSWIYNYFTCVFPGDPSCDADKGSEVNPIAGFRLSHEASPWIGDYGDIDLMPLPGDYDPSQPPLNLSQYGKFDHSSEVTKPYLYSVTFSDTGIKTKMTATRRSGYFMFTYTPSNNEEHKPGLKNDYSYLAIDMNTPDSTNGRGNYLQWQQYSPAEIVGFSSHIGEFSSVAPKNFSSFFSMYFYDGSKQSLEISSITVWEDNNYGMTKIDPVCEDNACHILSKNHVVALLGFKNADNVAAMIGTSYIGINQSEFNLQNEAGIIVADKFYPDSFDRVVSKNKKLWNTYLNRIAISNKGSINNVPKTERIAFYTALYHTLLHPYAWYECSQYTKDGVCDNSKNSDGSFKYIYHRSPYKAFTQDDNGNPITNNGYLFSGEGAWDVNRTSFPLFSIVYPDLSSMYIQGWLNAYKELGFLPEWPNLGAAPSMTGSYTDCVIADAYIRGVRGFDVNLAFDAIYKDATVQGIPGAGRSQLDQYTKYGYVPYSGGGYDYSITQTLEYAYADYCVSRMADAIGKHKIARKLAARAKLATSKIYDPNPSFVTREISDNIPVVKGIFRAKDQDGKWANISADGGVGIADRSDDYILNAWWGPYVEGSAWQYLFYMPYNVIGKGGLADKFSLAFHNKLSPIEALQHNLDRYFSDGSIAAVVKSSAGWTHEVLEMPYEGLGQDEFSDQPVWGYIYEYDYTKTPWKAQCLVRNMMDPLRATKDDGNPAYECFPAQGKKYPATIANTDKLPSVSTANNGTTIEVEPMVLFGDGPDGLLGDEDTGSMSAWYIESAMGLHAIPGTDILQIGSPLFDKIVITIPEESGKAKQLIVKALNNSDQNIFVKSLKLNGKVINLPESHYSIKQRELFRLYGKDLEKSVLEFDMSPRPLQ